MSDVPILDPFARLNELDREEWWDVARRINPNITREEFERQMAEFAAEKRRREKS